VLRAPDPFLLRELIPRSKLLSHKDFNVAVEFTADSAQLLRNLGFTPPSALMDGYTWPGKFVPFAHQRAMAEFWVANKRGFNLSDAGTGKTNGALWAADYLMTKGDVAKALILAPLSTVERIWTQDIFDTLMHRRCAVVHGAYRKRLDMLAADVDFYILNHDGVKVGQLAKLIRAREDIDLVIMDEGDFFCEASTEKYKALKRLLRPDVRLWWQTATPAANRPTQAWAQAKIVCPSRVPEYFGTFQRQTMTQVTPFKWAPRPNAEEAVYAALQPAIRFKKADCLDLPPVVTVERQVTLTKEQRDAYASMVAEMRMEQACGRKITAVNAADKLGKLRQILLGAILDPETNEYVILDHGPRLAELRRAIEAATAKAIVIVPYKGIVASLAAALSKESDDRPYWSVAVLNGDVSLKERNAIIREFKTGPDPHVLICHPRVMSHGLNLVEADTTIFYGPISSNAEYRQVIERNNRAGQVNSMTVVRIAAHPLEWGIYKIVDQRQVTQDNILNLYQEVLKPGA
jgi:SNF2 family DNA or RNA helicase